MTTPKRLTLATLALAAGLVVLFGFNLFWGSVALSPRAVAAALLGKSSDALSTGIILQLRLPRAVMVVLLGAALSAAGYLLQTFFANPIAGPFVMGISSGAKLAVALTMVVFLNRGLLTSSLVLIAAAFAGAMAAMAFVLAVAQRVQRMSILVICGVMIGYICNAVTDIVVTFAQDSNIVNLHNWSMGSFSGVTWGNVGAAACVVLPALAVSFCLSKPMAAYQLGEPYAQSVGVNVKAFRILLVLLPRRIYFGLMKYERYIMIALLAAVWFGALDTPLYYLNNIVWELLGKGTGYIDKIAYSIYYAGLGTVV